ncbi:MAG: amidophosphoribosyltransferase [Parcubacteria group bacterium]|nr:amidophosphoribosyltransferase [Parcubacteria group bacterium]
MSNRQEKCGIFGVYGNGVEASRLTFFGLFALQHRGQESSGIAAFNGKSLQYHKGMGLVAQVYDENAINRLSGHTAIGHNRYTTRSGSSLTHAQPVILCDEFAFAHNGNLPSVAALVDFLSVRNIATEGLNDSELMAQAIVWYCANGLSFEDAVAQSYSLFTGSFSFIALYRNTMIAARDECGIRPLSIGRLTTAGIEKNDSFVFSSETCALKTIGASFVRDVSPGEMVIINSSGMRSKQVVKPNPKLDIFEFVYFSRPDSMLNGKSVYEVRKNFGKILAREKRIDADMVIPVPETAIPVAISYAESCGIPLETALIKNRYIHRTFIEPEQSLRERGVQLKLNALDALLYNKRVIVLDDSIVRGTTSRQIVRMLRDAGAREVHFLVSSPPVKYPDFYGIDLSKQNELLAPHKTIEQMREHIGADTLYFLSYEGMIEATGLTEDAFCSSCFTGKYPIDLHERAKEFDSLEAGSEKSEVKAI